MSDLQLFVETLPPLLGNIVEKIGIPGLVAYLRRRNILSEPEVNEIESIDNETNNIDIGNLATKVAAALEEDPDFLKLTTTIDSNTQSGKNNWNVIAGRDVYLPPNR